eukprot:Pgem_evm1s19067
MIHHCFRCAESQYKCENFVVVHWPIVRYHLNMLKRTPNLEIHRIRPKTPTQITRPKPKNKKKQKQKQNKQQHNFLYRSETSGIR